MLSVNWSAAEGYTYIVDLSSGLCMESIQITQALLENSQFCAQYNPLRDGTVILGP